MKNKASLILTTALIFPLILWMSPGSQTLKSFKMEAPTALMGTIKTGNEITVTFDIVLGN